MENPNRDKQEAFLDLLEPHKTGLMRFCRALTNDSDTAKDLASEAILIAFERFDKLKNTAAIKSYLYTIASRLARTERKRSQRKASFDEALEQPASTTSPEILTDIHFLQEALDKLSEREREAIIMFEISGLSLDEIREIQGGSLSGIKMRLVRGRKSLQKMLGIREEKSIRETEFDTRLKGVVL
jgi:RNA polymerase sigma-70 factor (ECF subfamily)